MLHPAMTLCTIHSLGTFRGFNRLNFVGKIPFIAFDWVILIDRRLPSIVLNIVSIGTLSSIVAVLDMSYSRVKGHQMVL